MNKFPSMHVGTISSQFNDIFKYEIKAIELPFTYSLEKNNEINFLVNGKKKIKIELECDNKIIFIQNKILRLELLASGKKVKFNLSDVMILNRGDHLELSFSKIKLISKNL